MKAVPRILMLVSAFAMSIPAISVAQEDEAIEEIDNEEKSDQKSMEQAAEENNSKSKELNDSFEFDKEVIVETETSVGKKEVKKYKNAYVPMIRERCDTIVGTANYLSPEVI